MKTVVCVPDDLFEQAERLAHVAKRSLSQLIADALREYMARYSADEVTDKMNQVLSELDEPPDPFVSEAARRILSRSEW